MAKVSTKDRILDAALTLFSERGYDGASVDQIAEIVGIKGPSLYRHYKGKEDILDHLIEKLTEHYETNFGVASKVDRVPASMEELIASSMGRISFTTHDPIIIKTRKLLMIEQFRNPRLAALATKHNLTGLENLYTVIFEKMMEAGTLKKED
ncbi:MAG: TetR/AcrR family transcriptional regulator, partial [Dorea sp.]|nr:TetR/AcrR family transcriptional regulator [Dorea sp.]